MADPWHRGIKDRGSIDTGITVDMVQMKLTFVGLKRER